jgi:hypothetical protein
MLICNIYSVYDMHKASCQSRLYKADHDISFLPYVITTAQSLELLQA